MPNWHHIKNHTLDTHHRSGTCLRTWPSQYTPVIAYKTHTPTHTTGLKHFRIVATVLQGYFVKFWEQQLPTTTVHNPCDLLTSTSTDYRVLLGWAVWRRLWWCIYSAGRALWTSVSVEWLWQCVHSKKDITSPVASQLLVWTLCAWW
jgi:hypothetical protein